MRRRNLIQPYLLFDLKMQTSRLWLNPSPHCYEQYQRPGPRFYTELSIWPAKKESIYQSTEPVVRAKGRRNQVKREPIVC